ncbi:MAG: hypothetical protein WKF86_01935 [Acidimicrobiales bacterium]
MSAADIDGGGLLVGGEPEAILDASSALHEVAFRTDNVGGNLLAALGPAATTVVAATPFAPVQAAAVRMALAAVVAHPGAGLGQVAGAYEAASMQLRCAGQSLQLAGVVALIGSGALARLKGERARVLDSTQGIDLRREAMSSGLTALAAGRNGTVGARLVQRPDGTTFYVVELITTPKVAAGFGAQVNGFGGYGEAAYGVETTLRWAVPTREDAELLMSQAALGLVPVAGDALVASMPRPTEITIGDVTSATAVGTPLVVVGGIVGSFTMRREVTTTPGGGTRLAVTMGGAGQAGVNGVGGTGGAASLRVALERDGAGRVTGLTVTTTHEVDRGRHGVAPLESLNREATLEERQWELEVTPELRAVADRVADDIAGGRAPDQHDLGVLSDAVSGLEPMVRTYDVRHQQLSADVAVPGFGAGGSAGLDTATLR